MKTLKQIKEEVAKEYEFDSYLEMIDDEDGFDICIIDEIAKRHATEQLILHNVSQQRELLIAFGEWILSDEEDITSEIIKKDVDTFLANNSG